jgi:hypothetical protein
MGMLCMGMLWPCIGGNMPAGIGMLGPNMSGMGMPDMVMPGICCNASLMKSGI